MSMFCYQCEQKAKNVACTTMGVCGKDPDTAALQDLLVEITKGIAQYAHRARAHHVINNDVDVFVVRALFTTVTNVNFDPERLADIIRQSVQIRDTIKKQYIDAATSAGQTPAEFPHVDTFIPATDVAGMVAQGQAVNIAKRMENLGDTVTGLQELILYGLKGAAAYMDHAQILNVSDPAVFGSFHDILSYLADNPADVAELTATALAAGELNLKVMELLDKANTDAYGHPEPTTVRVTPVKGKAILVSGHDLKDLDELLKQTEGKGINVYTHGEMLPCLAYPGLKKYKHLAGNYGGAWQDQHKEFDAFPGAILMTTNCIQKPRDSYKDRIFTCGLVAWPDVRHIDNGDFSPVIDAALAAPGFAEDEPEKMITIGFGRNAVMNAADKVIDAVKAGKIRHFFLIGGCDGAKSGRNYYTEFAEAVPDDCVIMTLACGKYRFNKLEFGDIDGIPRLLDVGQCNDAYSAIQIAVALSQAFDTDVNSLPLTMILSWYEQKAVAILLTLLHLGIKGIKLGPTLPAFVTPDVLNVLVENFEIAPIDTVENDLQAALAG